VVSKLSFFAYLKSLCWWFRVFAGTVSVGDQYLDLY